MSIERVVEYRTGEQGGQLSLSWGTVIKSDFIEAAGRIGRPFPDLAADLWEIAAACHAVDRAVARPSEREWRPQAWSRTITVRTAVRVPDFWQRHRHLLERLLGWLTCDRWIVHFHQGAPGEIAGRPVADFLASFRPEDRVAVLFSGGLDSTAGLLREVIGGRTTFGSLLAVSVWSNQVMRGVQQRIRKDVGKRFGAQLEWLPFKLNMSDEHPELEDSQRTRGFAFLAAGIAAGLTAGCRSLLIFENGVGAINLPCTWGQVGAQAARPVHPRTLELMQQLADLMVERLEKDAGKRGKYRHIVIENRCRWQTKGQMIGELPDDCDDILAASLSCDTGFAIRPRPGLSRPCGHCSSCLLRRQALVVAGRAALDHMEYRGHRKRERDHLPAMLWQIARMRRALDAEDSWAAFVREFPDILCAPSAHADKTRLLDLYRRYCEEWTAPEVPHHLGFDPAIWGLPEPGAPTGVS
ncbi:adenine nucleotide alpha hydrolase family protein [Thermomonospora amylolytica]|uniref:hypothetical protein n=1 Tax=Thermomonospora amylolytica TaxID=1411117 RepID=UPI000E6B5E03|nr:hypothetical protein [Thermomonospora amylolytica]